MGLSLAAFASSPVPPNPTAREFQALADLGNKAIKADRVALMNSIGALLGIPNGGWPAGQSRLFQHGDLRVIWLLRRLAREGLAKAVAQNVERITKFVDADVFLTIATAAREHQSSIGALSTDPIHSYDEGGLDHLWKQKDQLGLPAAVTNNWKRIEPFINDETHREVNPAWIPARDQVLAYAAQMTASYRNVLNRHGDWLRTKGLAPSACGRVASMIWKTYAFLAPGGPEFDRTKTVEMQKGQKFGCFTALTYFSLAPPSAALGVDYLNAILTSKHINAVEWVRIAKARVAEALYLEHLIREARAVLIP
jgi:hypothetical protein